MFSWWAVVGEKRESPVSLGALRLAAVRSAASFARLFVRQTLVSAGLSGLVDDAELVASELVANAVNAAGVSQPRPTWSELNVPVIEVRLRRLRHSLIVGVLDPDPRTPIVATPAPDQERGRGLHIVAELSLRWDCFFPRSGGKLVWAELAIDPYERPRLTALGPRAGGAVVGRAWPRFGGLGASVGE